MTQSSTQSSQQNSRFTSPAHGPIPQRANFFERRYDPLQRYYYPAMALGGAALLGATYLGYNKMWKNKAPDPIVNTSTPTPTPPLALPTPTPKPKRTPIPTPIPRPRRLSELNVSKFKGTPERMVWH